MSLACEREVWERVGSFSETLRRVGWPRPPGCLPTTIKPRESRQVLKPRHAPRRNGYAERIVRRNPGTRLPVYLDMYDAATIAKVDDLVQQYMVDSRNFTSSTMPRCNGFPRP